MTPGPARKYDQRGSSGDLHLPARDARRAAGVRLYTALLPVGGENQGPFLDWNTAQSGFRAASQTAESSLATEFGKRQIAVRPLLRASTSFEQCYGGGRGDRDRTPGGQA